MTVIGKNDLELERLLLATNFEYCQKVHDNCLFPEIDGGDKSMFTLPMSILSNSGLITASNRTVEI